ncbi:MAG: FecR family protein [Bacteroides xylanisolvens]
MSTLFKKLYRQYIEKRITPSDLVEFRNELSKVPDEELWGTMIDMEKESTSEIMMPPLMKEQIRKKLHQVIWRHRWRQYMKYAAIVAIILSSSLGLYTWLSNPNPESEMIAIAVKSGSKAEMTLPDGTHVQLNAATNLAYDVNNSKKRLVKLSGEAFFEVAKNPDCPFSVMVDDLQITVIGTSFNVKTYKQGIVETSLLTGRIKISGGSLPDEYTLSPGEKAIYSAVDKTLRVSKADAHLEAGWRDNYLIFESAPLIDVIAQIERWYGVKIKLHRTQIAKDLLSGSFRNESIQNVIRSLSIQYNFKYEIHKEIITIY